MFFGIPIFIRIYHLILEHLHQNNHYLLFEYQTGISFLFQHNQKSGVYKMDPDFSACL